MTVEQKWRSCLCVSLCGHCLGEAASRCFWGHWSPNGLIHHLESTRRHGRLVMSTQHVIATDTHSSECNVQMSDSTVSVRSSLWPRSQRLNWEGESWCVIPLPSVATLSCLFPPFYSALAHIILTSCGRFAVEDDVKFARRVYCGIFICRIQIHHRLPSHCRLILSRLNKTPLSSIPL